MRDVAYVGSAARHLYRQVNLNQLRVGDWHVAEKTRWQWFNTAAFALAPDGKFGNLGRNVVIGPGTNNWDISLQKNFRVSERINTEFRAEFYNFPNHFSL